MTDPEKARPSLAALAARGAEWFRHRLLEPNYPLTRLEVCSSSLGVVRLVREQGQLRLGAAASLELPRGALGVSLVQPNVLDSAAYAQTLRAVLERAGALDGGRVGLVLPDPVARVAILPLADVAGGPVEEMVRFRLRRAVPFDIQQAKVALCPAGPGSLVAAAVSLPVLEAYEEPLRALGLEPGLVELSGLTLSEAVEAGRPPGDRLVINWDESYVSFLLSRGGAPLLVRTLSDATMDPGQVARETSTTLTYYKEKLAGLGLDGAFLRSAALPPSEAAGWLAEPLGAAPEILDPLSGLGLPGGSASQAVAGAAASALTRAA